MTATQPLGPRIGWDARSVLSTAIQVARPGTALEFGVGYGTTLAMIAAHPHFDPVVGFDSFTGLPEDWRSGFPAGTFACDPPEIPGTLLVVGPFDRTLPTLVHDPPDWLHRVTLAHIDCDLYSSTVTVLAHLGPYLAPGCIVVFDEYHGYPEAAQHEARAWREYLAVSGRDAEPIGYGPQQAGFWIS